MARITHVFKKSSQHERHIASLPQPGVGLGTSRIESFSDGVFAVAITLLVLNLQVPQGKQTPLPENQLLGDLLLDGPKFAIYVLSFVIVGIYWVGHHNTFHYIKHSDRILLWINNLLLLFIVFIPFPTALLGQYWHYRTSVIIYAGTLIATGLVLQLLWSYATHNCRLVEKDIDMNLVRRATRRNLTAPLIYLGAIVASFLSVYISLLLLLLVPILYIAPGRIDRHWRRKRHQETNESIGTSPPGERS